MNFKIGVLTIILLALTKMLNAQEINLEKMKKIGTVDERYPSAVANIAHVTSLKYSFNDEVGFCIIIQLFEIDISKNTLMKYRFSFLSQI